MGVNLILLIAPCPPPQPSPKVAEGHLWDRRRRGIIIQPPEGRPASTSRSDADTHSLIARHLVAKHVLARFYGQSHGVLSLLDRRHSPHGLRPFRDL